VCAGVSNNNRSPWNMIVKQRAALIAAVCGAVSLSLALPGMAAQCVDSKGKHYDCKVSNIPSQKAAVQPPPVAFKPTQVPSGYNTNQKSLIPPTTPAAPKVNAGAAPSSKQQPATQVTNNGAASKIVASGAGNANAPASKIVASGAGNAAPKNGSNIISTNGGGLNRKN
jgi:hypothetical protein